MSGIVAVLMGDGAPADAALLARLTAAMRGRAPDGDHVWVAGPAGLGHALLATAVEPARVQPATLDGEVWITADARVDARASLRSALRGAGHDVLPGASDAALLLHAYTVWGTSCAERVIGDYAFVLWDAPRRQMLAARSGFGVKPLYWARVAGAVIIGNSIPALLAHPACSDALDERWLVSFLVDGHGPDRESTVFSAIRRVPAGHTLVVDAALATRVHRHWTFPGPTPVRGRREGEIVEGFREVLGAAVEDRLRTRDVGMFLSGGLDSPTLAAIAHERLAATMGGGTLHAYTAVLERLAPDDEGRYAGLVARSLGIRQTYVAADRHVPVDPRLDHAPPMPEPVDDPLLSVFLDIAGAMSARCRVAFYGEDGEALFRPPALRTMLRTLPRVRALSDIGRYRLRTGCMPYLGVDVVPGLRRRLSPRVQLPPPARPAWIRPEAWRTLQQECATSGAGESDASPTQQLRPGMYAMLTSALWPPFLESVDPGFTGLPIEIRFPLLDERVIAFVAGVPPVPWCQEKELLRVTMRGRLPEPVLRRPKTSVHGDVLARRLGQAATHLVARPALAAPLDHLVAVDGLPDLDAYANVDVAWNSLRVHIVDRWLRHHLPRLRSPAPLPPSFQGSCCVTEPSERYEAWRCHVAEEAI